MRIRTQSRLARSFIKLLRRSLRPSIHYGFDDILNRVNERGRWTVTELEKAVLRISKHLGDWVRAVWDEANYLHVWGFHEAKLDSEDVMARLPDIERMVKEAKKILLGSN